ncbi:hypothetical protein [Rhizobium leguminosarum]|uniref:hypothetical protein n=1 Tax=Rhizobium leguminosarum TaxID=384 RepID=UPI00102FB24D|nr:hypothetical protein [Rhizobium leguminosarum]TAX39166.1 hypothetical protein ELI05_09475 [Rhizobium leguminosarum]
MERVSSAKFEKSVAAWLNDAHGPLYRFRRGAMSLYHNKLPREFRFFGVFHWLTKTSIASSAPGFAWFYGSIAGTIAVGASVVIFSAHSFAGFMDRMSREKASNPSDNQADILVRFGDLLSAIKSKASQTRDKDEAITACLSILEIFSRQITKSKKGDISVSLVLYSGSSRARMKVRHRNLGNERPRNREFDSASVLGHHACQSGPFPRVVHDIRHFGSAAMKSPTQSKMNYKSIFIIPLEVDGNNETVMRGFVSIDAKLPYAFYGNRANVIIVTCEPVINQLRELIQEGNGVRTNKK